MLQQISSATRLYQSPFGIVKTIEVCQFSIQDQGVGTARIVCALNAIPSVSGYLLS